MPTIIRSSDTTATRPAVTTGSATAGWFRHANPATSTVATQLTVDELNWLFGNCDHLMTQKGITGNLDDMTQLYNATLSTGWLTQIAGDARYVLKAGDTMTGLLTLSGSPSTTNHAANKGYVDTNLALKLNLTGGTLTGALTLAADPSTSLQAATKQYVDNTAVSVAGDTMTGYLTLNADPTATLHAATKQYVDAITAQFAHLFANNGYQKIPGGLIIQWGVCGPFTNNSMGSITFPIAFPTGVFVVVTTQNPTAQTNRDNQLQVYNKSVTGFDWYSNDNGGITGDMSYNWISIGY